MSIGFHGCDDDCSCDVCNPITEEEVEKRIQSWGIPTLHYFDELLKQFPRLERYKFVRKYIESKAELPDFIDKSNEYLKANQATIPDSHIEMLCSFLGNVRITLTVRRSNRGNTTWEKKIPLAEIADANDLKEEVRKIVIGARADVIYLYQDFAKDRLGRNNV